LFRIKTLEQLGKHSHNANQHCFAGLTSLQNNKSFGHRSIEHEDEDDLVATPLFCGEVVLYMP